jgi:hypothetical protein
MFVGYAFEMTNAKSSKLLYQAICRVGGNTIIFQTVNLSLVNESPLIAGFLIKCLF